MEDMDKHFSAVSQKYNYVRTTDHEPIEYIRELVSNYRRCDAIDVGCGPGRYALLLLQLIPQMHLTCIDRSSDMIQETTRLLHGANIDRFEAAIGDAGELPIKSDSIDVVFSFNAVHHFILPAFLREARRVLKKNGIIGIYTRLRSQNATSIWGKYFPEFNTVERRLYSLEELDAVIGSTSGLALDLIKFFRFERVDSLERLIERAKAGHYSTFKLYNEDRFDECISEFREKVMLKFSDTDQIRWIDGNVFLIIKAC